MERLPATRDKFNAAFENTFGLLVSNACPPCETEYIPGTYVFQRSNALADISGFYRVFGLVISSSHSERPDHIVQELEFMAFLIGMECQAFDVAVTVRQQRLEICRAAQTRFLREHLSWWTPSFARLLSREEPGGYYEAAGLFLATLIPVDRALLGVEHAGQHAEPSPLERPEDCEGCEQCMPG